MADSYQYRVFFDCASLNEDQKRRIKNYFRVRRKSSGGECGPLRKVDDAVYSVAFKNHDDQQRVLQKSEHVVELAEGCQVFTVRDTVGPQTSSTITITSSTQGPQPNSASASTPSPNAEEYDLRPDTFLIRYLSECSKASDELQSELATMACSAQIYPHEGRVLVRSVAQPEVTDTARNWKSEVDNLFDGYLCYYEVDPHKVRALLQSCNSHQTSDEVKVYSEDGVAVVVGKRSQVFGRLMSLEDLDIKQQSSEKQTKICRLGEAKLHLLWKKISHSLRRDFPGVKVSKRESGQLGLEGYVKEILGALDCISDKENLVFERAVSDLSPPLMTFLRKAYLGPGVLADILGVDDEVVIELQDTELHFFSLSADKLDVAVKALQGEFREVKLDVPNCSSVSSQLQEKLKSKTNEMNQSQCRAQAVFISDSTVCLLGHSKEVDELQETVTQFISDESMVQSTFTEVGSYSLCDDLQVLVCEGDITKVTADALVNAANESLDHSGGVAAALSKAGGPEVQKESKALVKQTGKIPTGDVVVTTGGNLKCQKLLHAVGPIGGKVAGRERFLLEKTVRSALDLAEMMELKSVAFPCISSGVYGVPVTVCSEAIVTAVKEFGSQGGRSLSRIILIDTRGEVVRAMREACDRILQGISPGNCTTSDAGVQMGAAAQDPARGATAGAPEDCVHVEITKGTTETQQIHTKVQKTLQKNRTHNLHQVPSTKRIVVLGKTGAGKSTLANTIFGEEVFTTNHSPNSGTKECRAETRLVSERSITLIDTPGLFDTGRSEEEVKPEIVRCITECAPGPHAFLIVLRVDKFTEQEKDVVAKICKYFSEDALKYAVVVFTHGEQLPKGMKIEDFVKQNERLSELVKKCGSRCHVFDNKYWKKNQQQNYRSNQFQVEELLNTIDKMVRENSEGYYTNEMLQVVEEEIEKEVALIKQSSGDMSAEQIREQAKKSVSKRFLIQLTGTATGVVLGAFFGLEAMARLVITAVKNVNMKNVTTLVGQIPPSLTKEVAVVAVAAAGVTVTAAAVTGGIIGGVTGHEAAEGAETVKEAAERAYKAVVDKRNATLSHMK